MSNRLFEISIRLKISSEEAVVVKQYMDAVSGKKQEIGHIVNDVAQDALETLVRRATMYVEKGAS